MLLNTRKRTKPGLSANRLSNNWALESGITGSSCRLPLDQQQSMRVDLDLECGKDCHDYDMHLYSRLPVPTHLFLSYLFFQNYFSGTVRISCITPAIDDLWGNLVLFPGLSGIRLTQVTIIVCVTIRYVTLRSNCLYIYIFIGCLSQNPEDYNENKEDKHGNLSPGRQFYKIKRHHLIWCKKAEVIPMK